VLRKWEKRSDSPTSTSRETDEAAQAELETEAEAASSSFFHTEKGAFAYKAFIWFYLILFDQDSLEEIWRKPYRNGWTLAKYFWFITTWSYSESENRNNRNEVARLKRNYNDSLLRSRKSFLNRVAYYEKKDAPLVWLDGSLALTLSHWFKNEYRDSRSLAGLLPDGFTSLKNL
jgi:hypothetical protein